MNKRLLIKAALVASLAVSPLASSYVAANSFTYTSLHALENQAFDVNKAFAPELYYARTLLSEEGQKAWDVALDILLNYDNSNNQYPLKDGNRAVTINYKELGISIDKEQAQYIQKYLVRQEPRMFHLKDWGATVSTDKEGVVETQTFYIGNGMSEGNDYQKTLLEIEVQVQKMLSNIKDDMTIYQSIQAIQKVFESSLSYSFEGASSDLRGVFLNKKAICGGYSKGFEYLLLRMGIENIWVEGYAGGYHAWNYVNVNGKWYLMDTTWGGKNWYLRGEVEARKVNPTYHIMPTLEKEDVPYKWGQYPGVWLNTFANTYITVGESFNPLDYIQGLGDIYESDLTEDVHILKNDVNTNVAGKYTVVYEVENKDGNKAQATLNVQVINGQKVLADQLNKISGNMVSKAVSLYYDGKEVPYDNGLFVGERGTMEYDISNQDIKYFEANVGINKNVRDNTSYGHYGKVQFEVYADDVLIYQSSILGWKDNYEHIAIEIPENTSKIKLVNVPKGQGNNHGAWGNPTFFSENSELNEAKANLEEVMAFANQITDISYVLEDSHQQNRLNNFMYVRDYAQTVLDSESTNVEDYKQAVNMLVYSIEEIGQTYVVGGTPIKNTRELDEAKANLEEVMAFANQITDISYVLTDSHQQNRLNNFMYARDYAQTVLASGSTKVEDYKQAVNMLVYSIEEMGQTYVVGGTPIKNTRELDEAKANLEEVMAFANQITDISYVLTDSHQESRLSNFMYARDYAQTVLASGSTKVEDYKQAVNMLVYSIEEMGQTYVVGGTPIKNTRELDEAKANLEEVMAFANQITDISYVLTDSHQESRLSNFMYARDYAQTVLASGSTKVEDYKQAENMLIYSISEINQTYVAGGSPIQLS